MKAFVIRNIFILTIGLFFLGLVIPYFAYTFAQEASVSATGCFVINQNDLPSNYPLPPGCQSSSTTEGFTNPFPGGWIPNRLDMGYDGTFTNQIVAPFDGTITYAGYFNGWNGSYGVQLEANTDVGLPTRSLYFTEGVYPLVTSGQKVSAGTPIVKAWPSPYGDAYATTPNGDGQIEWGVQEDLPASDFQNKNWHQLDTYSSYVGNCTSASQKMVLNFSQWAQQKLDLSAPAQTFHAGCP